MQLPCKVNGNNCVAVAMRTITARSLMYFIKPNCCYKVYCISTRVATDFYLDTRFLKEEILRRRELKQEL